MSLFTIALYELRRQLRHKSTLLILLALPLLLIFILGSSLSGMMTIKDKKIEQITVAMYVEDQGSLRETFQAFLDSENVKGYLAPVFVESRSKVLKRVKEGDSHFGLVVPIDFSEKVLQGQSTEWEVILGRDRSKNLTAQSILGSYLDRLNTLQASVMVLGPGGAAVEADSNQFGGSESRIEIGKLQKSNKNYTATQYYAAEMLVMFLLYSGMTASISMVNEKENHTLARLTSLPIHTAHIMLGKVLGNGLMSGLQAAVIILATHYFYRVDWGDSYYSFYSFVCSRS